MSTEILTGSAEFFPRTCKDRDYVVFRPQKPVFEYERNHPLGQPNNGDHWCRFCYRENLTKEEYFRWHYTENRWSLNYAPLITKGFLDYLGIDIFKTDYEPVYAIIRSAFCHDYHLPNDIKYPKWLYRIYIYNCFIRNGELTLSERQLREAYDLYRQRYPSERVVRSIYEFFKHDPELTEIGIRMVIPDEEFPYPPYPQEEP